jgi:hypothetical protein
MLVTYVSMVEYGGLPIGIVAYAMAVLKKQRNTIKTTVLLQSENLSANLVLHIFSLSWKLNQSLSQKSKASLPNA